MRFKDFFLPKIARSDPEIRKVTVRQEVNIEMPRQVIENGSDPEVCRVAQERIRELCPEIGLEHA